MHMPRKLVTIRPWGRFEKFTHNEKCTIKLLYVKKGKRNSYQYHNGRSEFWKIVSGRVLVTLNGKNIYLRAGGEVKIPVRAKHRVKALEDSIVLEITFGKF